MTTTLRCIFCVLSASIIATILMTITGCEEVKHEKVRSNQHERLIYQEDRDHNVVCYRFVGYEGISCVEIKNSCPMPGSKE